MLAAGLTLAAYFSATGNGSISLLGKLSLAIVFIASMYGQLDNEIRDFEIDVREKVTTLATILGKNISKILQVVLIVLTGVLSVYAIHTLNPSTNWVIQSAILLGLTEIGVYIFWVLSGKKYQLKQHIHRGLLITTMISLVALNLGIFIQ
jgi:1,4-dihydroxy-2-naphthoate octaprenyltransferase